MSTPASAELGRCPHCGAAVEGAADRFCCAGCELASAIISGAGLERYYQEREEFAPRPEARKKPWEGIAVATLPSGACEARMQISGLRCASCVWVVEAVLDRTEGVTLAEVSYGSGRALVQWDPNTVDLPTLANRVAALGYTPRPADAAPRADHDLLARLGVAAFAAANIMLLSVSLYAGWFEGMSAAWSGFFRWIVLVLATPTVFYAAAPFFHTAWRGLQHRVLHMDLPISIAIGVMYAHGLASTFAGTDAYLDSLAMLVALLLAGRVLEARGRHRASEAAATLAASLPDTARRVGPEGIDEVAVGDLVLGDRIVAGLGEELSADGVVVSGQALVMMALLTGESEPVAVTEGSQVVAGAQVVQGVVHVRVQALADDTVGGRMAQALREATDRGLRPTPADRLAPWFTAITLGVAAVALGAWTWSSGLDQGMAVMVAVLVTACPCALGLSYPLAAAAGLGAAARRGAVLRSGDALLDLAEVDRVALDKTGTLTGGVPQVVHADDATLRLAAALEQGSAHPVARAIVAEASARGIPIAFAEQIIEIPGRGVRGRVDGDLVTVEAGAPGQVQLSVNGEAAGAIHLADVHRDDAAITVRALAKRGLEPTLLTGDRAVIADRIGREIGMTQIRSQMDPQEKSDWLSEQQRQGHRVLFIGDGLNDGPALAKAHVGLAMGTGAASSVQAADGVIASDSLGPVLTALRVSHIVRDVVRTNVRRSVAYNVLAVGAAAAGLINPLVAAVLMPLSSAVVLWGSSRVEPRVAALEAP